LHEAKPHLATKLREFGLFTPTAFLLFGLFLALVHSLLEEYYWRWFVFGGLNQKRGRWTGIILSSVAFMAHHVVILGVFFANRFWSAAVPMAACVGLGGVVWAWLYDRSGSLYACWLSHALVDAAILAVGFDLLFCGG
jgi:membrane protease YdiL (CAAX protease family)